MDKIVSIEKLIKGIDEYVFEQENHILKRTPDRMSTIHCVAEWCKKIAIGLSKENKSDAMEFVEWVNGLFIPTITKGIYRVKGIDKVYTTQELYQQFQEYIKTKTK